MNIRAHQLVVKTPDRAIERVFAVGRDGRRRRRRRSSIVVVVGEGVVGAQRPKVRHAFRRLRARARPRRVWREDGSLVASRPIIWICSLIHEPSFCTTGLFYLQFQHGHDVSMYFVYIEGLGVKYVKAVVRAHSLCSSSSSSSSSSSLPRARPRHRARPAIGDRRPASSRPSSEEKKKTHAARRRRRRSRSRGCTDFRTELRRRRDV